MSTLTRLALIFFMSVPGSLLASSISPANAAAFMRVRILSAQKEILLRGKNLRPALIGKSFHLAAQAKSQTEMKIERRKLKNNRWAWYFQSEDQLYFADEIPMEGHDFSVGDRKIPGRIMLQAQSEQMDVIATLSLEEYVFGVLISEMPVRWPLETLKAQAIAIRSYALAVRSEAESKGFHLESSIQDQVLNGFHNNEIGNSKYAIALRAVRETEGVVLMDSSDSPKVAKAFYHSDCGGSTVTADQAWRGIPSAPVAIDPSCALRDSSRWSASLPLKSVQKILGGFEIEKILLQRASDKRVLRFANLAGDELRAHVGYGVIKSTRFNVTLDKDRFEFKGQGYGHGVGLCQWGARDWALQGWDHFKILKHYYPTLSLENFPRTQL